MQSIELEAWDDAASGKLPALPFATPSFASKFVAAAIQTFATGFVDDVFGELIEQMLGTPGVSYEIDASRFGPRGEDMGVNRSVLRHLVDRLLCRLERALQTVPRPIRAIYSRMTEMLSARYPKTTTSEIVAVVVVTQLLVPTLLLPQHKVNRLGGVEIPPPVLRGLELVAAVLGDMARPTGGSELGITQCLNTFMCSRRAKLICFVEGLAGPPSETERAAYDPYFNSLTPVSAMAFSMLGPWAGAARAPGMSPEQQQSLAAALVPHLGKLRHPLANQIRVVAVADAAGGRPRFITPRGREISKVQAAEARLSVLSDQNVGTCYPGTELVRGNVAEPRLNRLCEGYEPVEYTSTGIPGADPDLRRTAAMPIFNGFDDSSGVDRTSFMGAYKVIGGFPRNPVERTGMIGRGCLPRWGPNHFVETILSRWARNQAGEIVLRDGRPVLEVLAIAPPDSLALIFPNGHYNSRAGNQFVEETAPTIFTDNGATMVTATMAAFDATELFRGYIHHSANTDNAWAEVLLAC